MVPSHIQYLFSFKDINDNVHVVLFWREAKKQAFVYAAVFSLSQVVVYLMYAGAFRFGAYLIETGDMTATDVYKWGQFNV